MRSSMSPTVDRRMDHGRRITAQQEARGMAEGVRCEARGVGVGRSIMSRKNRRPKGIIISRNNCLAWETLYG
jgi:hypothetical protein